METVKVQELDKNLRPTGVVIELPLKQWERMRQRPVGRKRFKLIKEKQEQPKKKAEPKK